MAESKFDRLMRKLTSGQLEGQWDEIMNGIESVLKEEKMGTLDDMIHDIRDFLERHDKIETYINDKGDFTPPFEMVFSWFGKAVRENRKTKGN